MKQTFKLCWFCEKKCYSFVSICPECVKEKQKNTNRKIFFHKTISNQQEKNVIRNNHELQLK